MMGEEGERVSIHYLGIKLVSCRSSYSVNSLEQTNHLLLLFVYVVKATEMSTGNDLVNLVSQTLTNKWQVASFLQDQTQLMRSVWSVDLISGISVVSEC